MDSSFIGHMRQRNALRRLFERDQLPSTLLFSGPQGIGKKLVAEELARGLLCISEQKRYGGCQNCKNCQRDELQNAADYLLIDCADKEQAKVQSVKELLYRMNLHTFEAENRTIVIDNAELLSVPAANALLKSLEEPRDGNYFVLVCSNPSALPSTVLSRSQVWHFDQLTDPELEAVLRKLQRIGIIEKLQRKELNALIERSDGSAQNALSLLENDELWQTTREALERIASGDFSAVSTTSKSWGSDREGLTKILHIMRIVSRRKLSHSEEYETLQRWSQLLEFSILADHLIFQRNLNATYLLQSAFLDLAEGGQSTQQLLQEL